MTGGPNALIGLTASSPSASEPQCAARMPHELGARAVGAVSSAGDQHQLVRRRRHVSRKNCSTSAPRWSGCATRPPVIIGPTGAASYSSDAAMPKLPPPPRIAQKRSGFSSALARAHAAVGHHDLRRTAGCRAPGRTSASASRGRRQASGRRCRCVPTTPPVVARPCSCVSRLNSFHSTPPWPAPTGRPRVDVDALHRRQIDHQAAVDRGAAGDVVAAAADGDLEVRACARA